MSELSEEHGSNRRQQSTTEHMQNNREMEAALRRGKTIYGRARTPEISIWHRLIGPVPSMRCRVTYLATALHVTLKARCVPAVHAGSGTATAQIGLGVSSGPVETGANATTGHVPAKTRNRGSSFWQQSARFQSVTEKIRKLRPRSAVIQGQGSVYRCVLPTFPTQPLGCHGAPFVRYFDGSWPAENVLDHTVAFKARFADPGIGGGVGGLVGGGAGGLTGGVGGDAEHEIVAANLVGPEQPGQDAGASLGWLM